jgi:signal peptidase I
MHGNLQAFEDNLRIRNLLLDLVRYELFNIIIRLPLVSLKILVARAQSEINTFHMKHSLPLKRKGKISEFLNFWMISEGIGLGCLKTTSFFNTPLYLSDIMFGKKNKAEKRDELKPPKKPKKPTTWYGKIWFFIWHDNSAASWIVNIILAYLIIKFIVYPGLGLIFGTNYPIVAVVSNSMQHNGVPFDQWWAANEDYYLELNITKAEFETYPFENGFNRGDIMILFGKKPEDIKIGEIIVFQSKKPYPIIHRVISKTNMSMWVFQTKGDNNKAQIRDSELDETRILEKQILGRAAVRIPWLGYVKIWAVDLLNSIGLSKIVNPAQ